MNNQSLFEFYDKQRIDILCEVYSYPKSTLQLTLNDKMIQTDETIDCFYDDLSTSLLSNSLCLSQTNWRVRVRINKILYLSKEYDRQNLTCSVIDFPYGNSQKHSACIQLMERKGKISIISSTFNPYFSSIEKTVERILQSEHFIL